MAAPTLAAVTLTTATTNSSTSASISVQTNDVLVVAALGAGSASGHTFNAPSFTTITSGTITQRQLHPSASDCALGLWTASATNTATGTATLTQGVGGTIVDNIAWIFAAVRGVSAIGNTALGTPNTAKTVSLTPGQVDSMILWLLGDWNADAAVAPTPTPTTHNSSTPGPTAMPIGTQLAGQMTYYFDILDDQTSAGAVSYGIGGSGVGPFTVAAIEFQGTGGGTDATVTFPQSVSIHP